MLAQDHPRFLSVIAGACAAAGANIVDAQVFTTSDGRALDTILISREFDRDEDEQRRAERVGQLIEDVLSGKSGLPEIIARRAKPRRGSKAFRIEPRVDIRNTLSNRFTVIDVSGLDRPGLLSEITGHAVGPFARYRVGPYHDLRRKGDRHLLRERPHRGEDRKPDAAADDPRGADGNAGRPAGTQRQGTSRPRRNEVMADKRRL